MGQCTLPRGPSRPDTMTDLQASRSPPDPGRAGDASSCSADEEGPRAPSPTVLTIAGSDSGGGAGIQADLKTFEAFGVFGTSALTAVTAQNTVGVEAVALIDADLIVAQIRAVCEDLSPAACKTGMLGNEAGVRAAVAGIVECRPGPVVVDPVMVATSGDRLLEPEAVSALREALLPLARVVTPNVPEAELLSGREIADVEGLRAAAEALVAAGAGAVLLKGGHLEGETVTDVLRDGARETVFESPRLERGALHGTGCTLSAAIAALLARGLDLEPAVAEALAYTRRAIAAAPRRGRGSRPLDQRGAGAAGGVRPGGGRSGQVTRRTGPRCS